MQKTITVLEGYLVGEIDGNFVHDDQESTPNSGLSLDIAWEKYFSKRATYSNVILGPKVRISIEVVED